MTRYGTLAATAVLFVVPGVAAAQSTAGSGTTVVFPVTAQTSSFASQVTLFNPGPNLLNASVAFYEANDSTAPGPKTCNDINVSANRSVQFQIGTQCALGSGSHFGLLVVADKAMPPVNYFYGYTRVQNPQGIGFSVEGFPAQNFNNQVSNATGLKRQAASPTYQTNCFVGSLDQAVSYELRLFNDATGTQIGGTLSGSLAPFQQYRYLDVFGVNGVNAPAGDQTNVRAQFTQTSGGSANLIGFCTVQDNTSFGADFRIAKSYGSPSGTFFVQGGNAFGTTALLGTTDNQALTLLVNNKPTLRMAAVTVFGVNGVNVINGHPSNNVSTGVYGATIGGGGSDDSGSAVSNSVTGSLGTIGGGQANIAGDIAAIGGGASNTANNTAATVGGGVNNVASGNSSVVAGGINNTAGGDDATVAGGGGNTASGVGSTVAGGLSNIATGTSATIGGGKTNTASGDYSTIAGGADNAASGAESFATGFHANADGQGCFVFSDSSSGNPTSCFNPNVFVARALNGFYFYTSGSSDATYAGAQLPAGSSAWTALSDRNSKDNIIPVNAREVLDRLANIPIATWNWKSQDASIRHMGPMAQDFYAGFSLGNDDRHISTVDAEGVALAAIQGLNQLLQQKDAKIEAQQREIEELRERVSEVESLRSELDAVKRALARLTHGDAHLAVDGTP